MCTIKPFVVGFEIGGPSYVVEHNIETTKKPSQSGQKNEHEKQWQN